MATVIPRVYSDFRGVDFRSNEPVLSRSPDAVNMWKDYDTIESIRTRPRFKLIKAYDKSGEEIKNIKKIILFDDKIVFLSVDTQVGGGEVKMYYGNYGKEANSFHCRYLLSCGVSIIQSPKRELVGDFFIFNGRLYYKNTFHYSVLNTNYKENDDAKEKWKMEEVEPYIPTTSIARKPSGGGTTYEDVNILTGNRKNSFVADGKSKDYYLDSPEIESVENVYVNDELVPDTGYTVDKDRGKLTFTTAPAKPLTDGQDNVVIEFIKSSIGGFKKSFIHSPQVFDNRVFFICDYLWKNQIIHSSLNDPTYISDLDYYKEGDTTAKIVSMAVGNNALWVFKEPNDNNTTIFYHTPAIDDNYGKIYPSAHSSVSTGCIGGAVNFNDDIVFLSPNGLEGISGSVTSEQVISHRSSLVDQKLVGRLFDNSEILTAEWKNYLMIFINNSVYLADNKAKWQNNDHWEYEWFYWELKYDNKPLIPQCVYVYNNVIYIGTADGIFTLTDKTGSVESYWTTPIDRFNASNSNNDNMLKTTNKRGFVVEATGDVTVSAKTEKDGDFKVLGKYTGITDYFVPRIKEKKFKDLQLKFSSNTRFSLESAKVEAIVGGYIKR